jgi:hypothetical protein
MFILEGITREEFGIVVSWKEASQEVNEQFSFSELVDMQINALDLLDRSDEFGIDKKNRRILPARRSASANP